MNPGWNLGNTLDAVPDEGSWNNAPVEAQTFDDVVAAGFKSVRIPITYADHFASEAPDYEVDAAWLKRVSDVIDMALERDLYVLTNVHHDSWQWADVTAADTDAKWEALQDKFRKLWVQIGRTLGCKSSLVSFESINEPPAETAEHGARINRLNEIFLEAIAEAGGFNSQRVVTLVGGVMDAAKTTQWFQPPASNITNPWALQYHYYSPYDFVFGAWGDTVWGSDEDKAAMEADLSIVPGNFTGVPLVIGEFDASPIHTESAARWKWFEHFTRIATELNTAVMLWDNGEDNFDREARTWRDQAMVDIILSAVEGTQNSLPDSTVDAQAEEQSTSAYIFHRVGHEVADEELPWLFNGNTLESITASDGTELAADKDYTVAAESITFKSTLISRHISANSSAGVYETFTLSFSAGADIPVKLVQWDTPKLAATSSTAKSGADLSIPVEWNGIKQLATVKMLTSNGTYLVDDWTQYMGPLQRARGVSITL